MSTLSLWSEANQTTINQAIEYAKARSETPFAVFDADNTIWKYDIEEALLAWLESKGLLSISRLNPSILPVPPREQETIFSYYDHLSTIDHSLCYLWACQAFEGFQLSEIYQEIQEMLSTTEPIPVRTYHNGIWKESTVSIPVIYPAQRQLIQYLMASGVDVWVVSASLEEIVRCIVSNPRYGVQIPPHHVIGVNLLLR